MDKKLLRRYHTALRAGMSAELRKALDDEIFRRITECEIYKSAEEIFIYVSGTIEVDTRRLIDHALAEGRRVAVPKCGEKHSMIFRKITSVRELCTGSYGIPEPPDTCCEVMPQDKSLIIVPALSVDANGFRLGFGGGYYDRYLAEYPHAATLCPCYAANIVERLPSDEYDIRVGYIINENKLTEAVYE